MRIVTLAALAALTILAPATPVAAQGNLKDIFALCPDLPGGEVMNRIATLTSENYAFSTDPDLKVQAEDTAYQVCGYGYNPDSAEVDEDQPQRANIVGQALSVIAPPHHGQRQRPHYPRHMKRPPPRSWGHPPGMRRPPPRPHYGHRHPPAPGYGYGAPVRPPGYRPAYGYGRPVGPRPPMGMAGGYPAPRGYPQGRGGYGAEQAGSVQRVVGGPIAPTSTTITEHPPGTPQQYRCNRDRTPATPGTGWCD